MHGRHASTDSWKQTGRSGWSVWNVVLRSCRRTRGAASVTPVLEEHPGCWSPISPTQSHDPAFEGSADYSDTPTPSEGFRT